MDCVYGPYLTEFNKYRIQKIQNSCIQFIYKLKSRDHVSQHLQEAEWLNMGQRRFLHMSCLIYKVISTDTPLYLRELIVRRRDLHNANIRYKDALSIPKHKTEFYKCSFSYQAAHIFNLLPTLENVSTITFRNKIKDYIVQINLCL